MGVGSGEDEEPEITEMDASAIEVAPEDRSVIALIPVFKVAKA